MPNKLVMGLSGCIASVDCATSLLITYQPLDLHIWSSYTSLQDYSRFSLFKKKTATVDNPRTHTRARTHTPLKQF